MVVPEQVLHSVLVLTWDAENMAARVAAAEEALGLGASDREDAVAHINAHRGDGGDWGGKADSVNGRARERISHALEHEMLPASFNDLLEEEDDMFATLGVQSPAESAAAAGDALEAFLDDDDEEAEAEAAPSEKAEEGEEEDEDMFATLGVDGPAVALAAQDPDDPLAALMDDDDEEEESEEAEVEAEPEEEPESEAPSFDAAEAYRMVLETVWVDGVLDPGEVSLLARRREELGLTFEDHLALVREMLG